MRKLLAVLSVLFYNVHVSALDLGIPIACDYGEDCIIFNYYDKSVEADVYTDHTC